MNIFRICFMIFLLIGISSADDYSKYIDEFWSDNGEIQEIEIYKGSGSSETTVNTEVKPANEIDEYWIESYKSKEYYQLEIKSVDFKDLDSSDISNINDIDEFWNETDEDSGNNGDTFENNLAKARKKTCDLAWQIKVCKGEIMCAAHKCFYPKIKATFSYFAALKTLSERLNKSSDKMENEISYHIKKIIEYGLPKDNKKYEFKLTNSLGYECKYYLQNREDKEIIFQINSCNKEQKIDWIFKDISNGTLEIYRSIGK